MRIHLGAGWRVHHLTDRVVEIRRDDYAYHRLTGRPGFVRFRAEPGMDRNEMVERAMVVAMKQDEALSYRVAKRLMPSVRSLALYRAEQHRLATAFRTPEDESVIGRKR